MIEIIEDRAKLSIARGCGFAALAIGTLMIGLSAQIVMAFQAGGFLCLIGCMVLLLKARSARRRPYRKTELWVMLKPDERPDAAIAQQIIGNVLQDVYMQFAAHAAWLAVGMLSFALAAHFVSRT